MDLSCESHFAESKLLLLQQWESFTKKKRKKTEIGERVTNITSNKKWYHDIETI